jgi:hypothetical protein
MRSRMCTRIATPRAVTPLPSFGHLVRVKTGRKLGELMDDDAWSHLCHDVAKPIGVEHAEDGVSIQLS